MREIEVVRAKVEDVQATQEGHICGYREMAS